MLYDNVLKRGVRKKYPNPQKVELPRDASLQSVFDKAKELYFEEFDIDVNAKRCQVNAHV